MLVPASLELILNAVDTLNAALTERKSVRGAERLVILSRLLEAEIPEEKEAGKTRIEPTETALWL